MWLLQHFEPQEHDELIAETLLVVATAFLDGHNGNLHSIFVPADPKRHGARPMTVDEIRYRAFVGLASQLRHATPEGQREGVQICDQNISEVVAWIHDDPVLVDRLGGSLTNNSVRNARTEIGNNRGPIAAYARGIPVPAGTVEEQAGWLRAQLDHRKGEAYDIVVYQEPPLSWYAELLKMGLLLFGGTHSGRHRGSHPNPCPTASEADWVA